VVSYRKTTHNNLLKCTNIHICDFCWLKDEPDIQNFLKSSLTEAGYQVDAAADGKTAERLVIDGQFDILIVDLGLPDQDGISLILKLRQLGVRAPMLILSARRSVDDRVRAWSKAGRLSDQAFCAGRAIGQAAQLDQAQQSSRRRGNPFASS